MNKKRAKFNFVLTSILLVLALFLCFAQFNLPSNNKYEGLLNSIGATSEITNGNNALFEITSDNVVDEDIDKTVSQIKNILNGQGFVGSKVYRVGNYVKAEIESKSNSASILSIIGTPKSFYISETKKENTDTNPITKDDLKEYDLFETDIVNAYFTTNLNLNKEYNGVTIEFSEEGKTKLEKLTERVAETSDKKVYFYIGGIQSTSLSVESKNSTGVLSFYSESYSKNDAQNYALQILMASTGVELKIVSNNTSTATLGSRVLLYTLIAVAVVLMLAMIVLPILFGDLGFVADLSVLFGGVFIVFLLQALPFTTGSIATIFGSLLGMGIMIVCHIIYLNKIKSEFYYLHKMQLSARTGFKKSWLTNLDICVMAFVGALSLTFWNIPFVSTFAIGLAVAVFVALFNTIVLLKDFVTWYVTINTKNYKRVKFTKGENNEN